MNIQFHKRRLLLQQLSVSIWRTLYHGAGFTISLAIYTYGLTSLFSFKKVMIWEIPHKYFTAVRWSRAVGVWKTRDDRRQTILKTHCEKMGLVLNSIILYSKHGAWCGIEIEFVGCTFPLENYQAMILWLNMTLESYSKIYWAYFILRFSIFRSLM